MAMSCGVGHRRGSDSVLLRLLCRLAATAPIGPLAWNPPYATGAALGKTEKKKKKKKKRHKERSSFRGLFTVSDFSLHKLLCLSGP